MSILSRLRALRSRDAACARALFAGHDLPSGAPARQRALARLLEAAAGPGTAQELADEVAATAAFAQVTRQARPTRATRGALVAAACAVAVGGTTVYATVMPSPHRRTVTVPFGVPASGHIVPAPATTVPPRLPGRRSAHPKGQAAYRRDRQATNPHVQHPSRGGLQAGGMPAPPGLLRVGVPSPGLQSRGG